MFRRLMFILFIVGFGLFGEGEEQQIKLQTVFEKTFKDTIVDVIFDTATVSLEKAKTMGWKEEAFTAAEKAKGKVTIPYPKVIIFKNGTRRTIKFLEYTGKVKKEYQSKPGAVALISLNGKFIGITAPIMWHGKEGYDTKFTMMTDKGDILWEIEGLGEGPYEPSPNGELAVGQASVEVAEAPLEIYTRKGLLKKIDNPYGIIEYAFSNDGKYLAISVGESPVWWKPKGYLMLLNSSGQLKWKKDNFNVWSIAFNKNDEYMCFKSANDTSSMFLNLAKVENGKVSATFPMGKGRLYYHFSDNENKLLVVNELKGTLSMIDIPNGKIDWTVKIKEGIPRTLSATKGLDKIVVGAYPNKVYIYDKKGNFIGEEDLPEKFFTAFPKIKISPNGERIIYAGRNGKLVVAKVYKGGEQ